AGRLFGRSVFWRTQRGRVPVRPEGDEGESHRGMSAGGTSRRAVVHPPSRRDALGERPDPVYPAGAVVGLPLRPGNGSLLLGRRHRRQSDARTPVSGGRGGTLFAGGVSGNPPKAMGDRRCGGTQATDSRPAAPVGGGKGLAHSRWRGFAGRSDPSGGISDGPRRLL